MLFHQNSYLKKFNAKILSTNANQLILNQTLFYAKSGGQPGDTGYIEINDKTINIIDTIKDINNKILHITDSKIDLKINEKVTGNINWDRSVPICCVSFDAEGTTISQDYLKDSTKTINKIFKNSLLKSLSAADDEDVDTKNSLYVTIVNKKFKKGKKMIEPLLCGIVLGLVPITLLGLFVSAWNQYRRGSGMLDID